MITIKDKSECCGCSACASICPKSCISMKSDDEGFLYPHTDVSLCVNCSACNRVCPMPEHAVNIIPFGKSTSYAACSIDDKLLAESSSGGVFSLIASKIIKDGGVVFGVAWEGEKVCHIKVNSIQDLNLLRGSKYTQSDVGSTLREVRNLLEDKIPVLYSGTPCEIAGLKSYIKTNSDLLTTVEVACHGAPSPKVLSAYLEELKSVYGVDNIKLNFRSKVKGWNDYHIDAYNGCQRLLSESHRDNIFMKGFLHELYSRPSCHNCQFKGNYSGADFTLADFWGIETACPDFPSESGASLVIANTEKGKCLWETLLPDLRILPIDLAVALRHNGSLLHSETPHPERSYFFKQMSSEKSIVTLINRCLRMRKIVRFKLILTAILKRIFLQH